METNVPQRQEETRKQMCAEINGVGITNLDAPHRNRSEERAAADCFFYRRREPPGDGRGKGSKHSWIPCTWCTGRRASSSIPEHTLICAANSSSIKDSIIVGKKCIFFSSFCSYFFFYLGSSLICFFLRKRISMMYKWRKNNDIRPRGHVAE